MKPIDIRRDSVDELHNGKSKQKGSPHEEALKPRNTARYD